MLAVGEVKGFAFTLGLTTVFDIIVSFLIMAPLMQLAARRPAFAKPSMNGLGGIFALAEERREQGFFSSAHKRPSTEEAADDATEDEEPVNKLRSVVGPASTNAGASEASDRPESGDSNSAKPSDQDSQEEK